MKKDSKKKLTDLVKSLSDENTKEEIKDCIISDPVVALRNNMASFLSKKFEKLEEESDYVRRLRAVALNKAENDEKVTLSEVGALLNQARMRETEATEAVLQFFKPTPNSAEIPIFQNNKEEEEEGIIDNKSAHTLDEVRRLLTFMQLEKEKERIEKEKKIASKSTKKTSTKKAPNKKKST